MKRKISNIRLNNRSASNYFLNRLGSNNSNERAGQVYSIIVDLLIAELSLRSGPLTTSNRDQSD